MKTIILTETQVKNVINKIISEQSVGEFSVGTDASRISHAYLSSQFGLPDGESHENFYYVANVSDVINMSADASNVSKFLSVFRPLSEYSKDKNYYYDYLDFDGQKIINQGRMDINLSKGKTIVASHNGLLNIFRVMKLIKGGGGVVSVGFGKSTSGVDAERERDFSSVTYNSNKALNQNPMMNGLTSTFVALSISDYFIKISNNSYKEIKNRVETVLPIYLKNIILGVYGFMDVTKKDEIIKTLVPKGYITEVKFDLNPLISELKKLDFMEDGEIAGYGGNKLSDYNENKRNKLNQIGTSFLPKLIEELKNSYMTNFKIYIEHYLPKTKDQILPMIPKVNFSYMNLGEQHYLDFHSTSYQGTSEKSTLSTQTGTNKKGG